MKFHPVTAELHGDGQTDGRTDAKIRIKRLRNNRVFRNFVKAPKSNSARLLLAGFASSVLVHGIPKIWNTPCF